MRVLLITRNFPPLLGGASQVYHQLYRQIGADLAVLASSVEQQTSDLSIAVLPNVYRSRFLAPVCFGASTNFSKLRRSIHVHLWNRSAVAFSALRIVRKVKPELVCIGSFSEYWLADPLRIFLRVPVIFYTHGEELTIPETSRFVGNRNFRALRKADGVIAVSRFTREKLTALGVRPDRIQLITNGVDLRRFTPGEKDPAILSNYGLRGKQVLLTVGRLDERKGYKTVLSALPQILRCFPDVVYVVAGFGGDLSRSELESLARKLGVYERLVFIGTVEPEVLPALYRSCDVFVMPNYALSNGDTEGFGLVFLEAAACGKPTIGGRDGGVPDAIVDRKTGILVDGLSVEQFASATIQLLGNPELAQRLGRYGCHRVQVLDWQIVANNFREFCCRVVQKHSSPI